ncbi:acyl carrier protein [Streptomyces pseudovenezuelae]|jgi:acyl carrier protein|uniref:Acyl carrier protein n=1 Tax=Streptomyces pseudovenezuelae TaxID=67350 RepID=A0ABT6M0K2_9ACTN|nr:acyl carrier protein [Streptomyces pseudovenezuelae]MDH6222091.1 acyl carrier protein [Streptomyces pseudovenezuelae]
MSTTPPNAALSHVLAAVEEVFGREVSSADSFFSLGGDSIEAVEITTALEQRLGKLLDATLVLRTPNFGELAAVLGGREPHADAAVGSGDSQGDRL